MLRTGFRDHDKSPRCLPKRGPILWTSLTEDRGSNATLFSEDRDTYSSGLFLYHSDQLVLFLPLHTELFQSLSGHVRHQ